MRGGALEEGGVGTFGEERVSYVCLQKTRARDIVRPSKAKQSKVKKSKAKQVTLIDGIR